MKLGIVISSQPSSFSALPFTEGIAENVAKVKKLGYDGVEMAVRNPEQLDLEMLIQLQVKENFLLLRLHFLEFHYLHSLRVFLDLASLAVCRNIVYIRFVQNVAGF